MQKVAISVLTLALASFTVAAPTGGKNANRFYMWCQSNLANNGLIS
jgi:hypothetical protein